MQDVARMTWVERRRRLAIKKLGGVKVRTLKIWGKAIFFAVTNARRYLKKWKNGTSKIFA